jgi:hypothetical protein
MVSLDISLDTVFSVLGIVLGIVIPFIASIIWLARKLDRIEDNTQPIKTINETMIRLDERTTGLGGRVSGTVIVTLKNLGKVTVSATPMNPSETHYSLQFEKPIKFEAIHSVACQTGLDEKEKQMFSRTVRLVPVNPTHLVIRAPSSDPKLCSEYVSLFLRWLDSDYLAGLEKSLAEYEQIKV